MPVVFLDWQASLQLRQMWITSKAEICQDVDGKGEEYHQAEVVTVTRLNCTRLCVRTSLGWDCSLDMDNIPFPIRDIVG